MGKIRGQDKGANGRIAEYACAFYLAKQLQESGFRVTSDLDRLWQLREQEIQKYHKSLTAEQIGLAIQAGEAMGNHMFDCIKNRGQDLIFVDYDFDAQDHVFDIEPTGAAQNKGTTDDMVIHVLRDGNSQAHRVLLSLKVSASDSNSQGSKSPLPLLYKMFVDPQANKVKADRFVEEFGATGQQFVDLLEDFKRAGREFLASADGQAWAEAKYAERLARGKDPKKSRVKADTNFFRSKEVGDYYARTRGQTSEHRLSELFVALYNQGKQRLAPDAWPQFNEGFKQAIGFDDVITYKTVCDKNTVREVVSSATNQAYQQMYRALNKKINVTLECRSSSSGIGVTVSYDNTVLDSLACSIWKDGTIQFKFDSSKEIEEDQCTS